jgi:hypothetical protein
MFVVFFLCCSVFCKNINIIKNLKNYIYVI